MTRYEQALERRRWVIRRLWNGGRGLKPREIAEELGCTRQTVDHHIRLIKRELATSKNGKR